MSDQKFSKQERLKSRKKIHELFNSGNIIHHYPFKIIWQFEKDENSLYPSKIAISVSKRSIKKASDRNHLKRKIREVYRRNKAVLYNSLQINDQNINFIVIYHATEDLKYLRIEKELIFTLKKLIKQIDNK